MKPNDKAIEAALRATTDSCSAYQIQNALDAAYAAQFQNDDYAGLIERLRKTSGMYHGHAEIATWPKNPDGAEAADALEAVLAEREAWKGRQEATAAILKQVESERDALAARLAPVDDEALVEIVAKVLQRGSQLEWSVLPEEWKNDWRRDARVAIAAIRPHVEAAERERCAKIVELDCDRHSTYAIAEAIRSGK